MVGLRELNMALDHVNNNLNNSKMSFDKIKSETLTGIKPYSCRAEINLQPRESHAGQKLVIANQWVSSCNSCESHLTKAEPAGQ